MKRSFKFLTISLLAHIFLVVFIVFNNFKNSDADTPIDFTIFKKSESSIKLSKSAIARSSFKLVTSEPKQNSEAADMSASGSKSGSSGIGGGGDSSGEQGAFELPVLLNSPKPLYPKEASNTKLSGQVVVAIIVNKQGNATFDNVISISDEVFRESALNAVSGLKFKPASFNGDPVDYKIEFKFNFKSED